MSVVGAMSLAELTSIILDIGEFETIEAAIAAGYFTTSTGAVAQAITTAGGAASLASSSTLSALELAQTGASLAATQTVKKTAALGLLKSGTGYKAAGLLNMELGAVAAAAAPFAGMAIGTDLYKQNPKLWVDLSTKLLPFCHPGTTKIPTWLDIAEDTQTGSITRNILAAIGVVEAVKETLEASSPLTPATTPEDFNDGIYSTGNCGAESLASTIEFYNDEAKEDFISTIEDAGIEGYSWAQVSNYPVSEINGQSMQWVYGTITIIGGVANIVGRAVYIECNPKGVLRRTWVNENESRHPLRSDTAVSIGRHGWNPQTRTYAKGVSPWAGEPAPEIEPWPNLPVIVPFPSPGVDPETEPCVPVTPGIPETEPEVIPFPTPDNPPENWPEEEPWPEVIPFPWTNPDPEGEPWPEVIPFPMPEEPPEEWPNEPETWPEPYPDTEPWPKTPEQWPETVPWPDNPPDVWPEEPWPETPEQWPEEVPWPETTPDDWPEEVPWPESPEQWPEEEPWPETPEQWPEEVPWPETAPDNWPEGVPWPESPEQWPEEVPWPETKPDDWPENWPEGVPWPETKPDDWPENWPEKEWPDSPEEWPEDVPWPTPWPEEWPDDQPWPIPWPEELPYPVPFPNPYPGPDSDDEPKPGELNEPEKEIEPWIQPDPDPQVNPDPMNEPIPGPEQDPSQEADPISPFKPTPNPDPDTPIQPAPEPDPDPDPDTPPVNPIPPPTGISPVPILPNTPSAFDSTHGLISVYNPTPAELYAFADWLWVTYADATIDKIWNNPFDGVITLFELYCTPTINGRKNIRSGFLDSGIASDTVSRYTEINCGTLGIPEYYGNYFDYSPYSKAHIYLPFIGIQELNVDDIVGHFVNVTYRIDEYNGSCIAMITTAKVTEINGEQVEYSNTMYQFSGNCSVELPLTGGSQASIKAGMMTGDAYQQAANISATGQLVGGLASTLGGILSLNAGSIGSGIGSMIGAAGTAAYGQANALSNMLSGKSTVQKSGSFGASHGALGIKTPFITVTRPKQIDVANYNKLYGFPAHKMVTIGTCEGYLRCREVHVKSATATDAEKSLIEQMLKSGVYVT